MSNMNWLNDVNPDNLGEGAAEAYAAYKTAYRAAKAQREAFERIAREHLATEHCVDPDCLAFSYRFGKLSLGFGEARPARKPAAKSQSLADWFAERA